MPHSHINVGVTDTMKASESHQGTSLAIPQSIAPTPPPCEPATRHRTVTERAIRTDQVGFGSQQVRLAYSVKESAEILGVSEKTIRRLIQRRLLRASRALRHLLIPKKELDRFLDETI